MKRIFGLQLGECASSVLFFILFVACTLFGVNRSLEGAITPTGNVEPGGTWGYVNFPYIGRISDGSLVVDAGSVLWSFKGCIATNRGVIGTATITGVGSKWYNDLDVYVGFSGIGTLNIEAGGQASIETGEQVSSATGYLGYNSGSSGTATVTGVGSKWTINGDLYVGKDGTGKLTVADGGAVTVQTLYASVDNLFGNGTVTATKGAILDGDIRFDAAHGTQGMVVFGSGGTLTVNTAGGNLGTGYKGNGNVTIAGGVEVTSVNGYLGYGPGSFGTATVTGAGSKWTNLADLYVGYGGAGTLTVTNGAAVTTKTLYASLQNLLGNGAVTATAGAVLDADLRFDASHGAQATVAFGSGGTLTVNAAGGTIGVGYKGSGCLTVADAGMITSSVGYLGYSSNSSGTATVTGAGSKWTNSGDIGSSIYLGYYGTGTLHIEAAGQVSNSDSCYIGYNSGSSGTATVTGSGSQWANKVLFVGYNGTGTLCIGAGGQVSDSIGDLGHDSGSSGTATVTGAGSKWTNSTDLYIGDNGTGMLTVSDGGIVTAQTLYASLSSLSGNGTITITKGAVLDADFRFDAAHGTQATVTFGSGGMLTVKADGGKLGAGYKKNGSLTISEGVAVTSASGYLGYNPGSSGTAAITSAGSKWTISDDLYVGNNGAGTLKIEAGGQVSNSYGYLGFNSGSSGMASITGPGSQWNNSSFLRVGYQGTGMLKIEAGGQVFNSNCDIGYLSGSSGIVTVTGVGSKWTNSGDLYVGYNGSGMLTVSDGGTVTAGTLYASLSNLSGNGTITAKLGAVLDADLRFDAAHGKQTTVTFGTSGILTITAAGGDLGAGYKGNGTLTIADAMAVTSASGYLGCNLGSTGKATVTGAGTKWTSSRLYIGYDGVGTLRIEAGGQVNNTEGYLGYEYGSSGTVTVTGAGSNWTCNNRDLTVGYKGTGALYIEAGGQVTDSTGYLGSYYFSSSGSATVTGAGSKWTNSGDLYVGYNGSGMLTVSDGGTVTAQTLYASLGCLSGNGSIIAAKGAVLDADVRFNAAHPAQSTVSFGSGGTLTVNLAGGNLGVGYKGNGTLTVAEGVVVTSPSGYLGYYPGSSGMATITGTGSKWNDGNILYVGNNGSGTLRIEAGGQVTDTYGYLGYNSGSSGTATVTGAASKWTNSRLLIVGHNGSGTLKIEAGGQVSNIDGVLGNLNGSSGTATVTGKGSQWTNSGDLDVGSYSSGTLRIEAGGQVTNSAGYISHYPGSSGTAMVIGVGSSWINSSNFYIGQACNGTLHVRDGGMVTAYSVSAGNSSLLTIDAGYGSVLWVNYGAGTISNTGKIRFVAGPQPAAGSQYSPIAAGTWSGSGSYQALGGTWNSTTHKFTTSQTLTAGSGTPVTVDLAQRQRVLVEETARKWTVGVSFLAKTGTGNTFDFTATGIAGADLAGLEGLLSPGQSVFGGWNLGAVGSGYIASDPVYLSLGIPATFTSDGLQLWQLKGSSWSRFSVDDWTVGHGYASFTSTGLSGYAVTGLVTAPGWKTDGDGVWQNGANWTSDPNAPGGVNAAAVLGAAITAPRTVTLSGPLTLGVLTFDSVQHYTLAGAGALNLEVNAGYEAKIEVKNSDGAGHAIEAPLMVSSPLEITVAAGASLTLAGKVQNPTGKTLTYSGGGTLTVTQGIETTGAVNVLAGTLITPSVTADTLTIGGGTGANLSAVPEPSSVLLLLAALAGVVGRGLMKKSFPAE